MAVRRLAGALLVLLGIGLGVLVAVQLPKSPAAADDLRSGDFVRVEKESLPLFDAIDGVDLNSAVHHGERLLVVDRPRVVGERLWLRVEYFSRNGSSPYALARFAWLSIPDSEAWLSEYVPDCSGQSDRADVAAMAALNPAETLHCFGGSRLTLAPAIVRREPPEAFEIATPEWLAATPGLQVYGRNGWNSSDGSIGGHIVPGGVDLPLEEWLEVTGHFDDPASSSCRRTPTHPEFGPITAEDGVLWCRQQFVIEGFVAADQPDPTPAPIVMDGRWSELPSAPIAPRDGPSGVWTGSEMIIWGGTILESEGPDGVVFAHVSDGAAFDPTGQRWRSIAPAPIQPRTMPYAAWTGTEMLVWGGYGGDRWHPLLDGGRYDPVADAWREIPPAPLPDSARGAVARATWDGRRIIAWRGVEVAAFEPASGSWERLPDVPLRAAAESVAIVGGNGRLFALAYPPGISAGVLAFSYNGDWTPLPQPPLRALDADRDPIWTGTSLLVFSYSGSEPPDRSIPRDRLYAARYDPASDSWSLDVSPHYYHWSPHTWTGTTVYFPVGYGAFHERERQWVALPNADGLPNESFATVWTGDSLLIWGGSRGESFRPLEGGWAFTPD
jgi:hypothetical protein